MLIPLNIRNSIYEYLLNEGVMTAIDDPRPKVLHPAVKVLHLPTEIVPATLNKPAIDTIRPGMTGPSGPRMPNDGRSAYRRGPVGAAEAGKDVPVAPEGEVHFRG